VTVGALLSMEPLAAVCVVTVNPETVWVEIGFLKPVTSKVTRVRAAIVEDTAF